MAKGLRASSKKSNRTKLRARVFQPVEDARLERLHQKLLETATQPKPAKERDMDVDVDAAGDAAAADTTKEDTFPKDMDVDGAGASAPPKRKLKDRKTMRKAKLERRKKPKNQIAFPRTRGKGALKPFSESRVRKSRA